MGLIPSTSSGGPSAWKSSAAPKAGGISIGLNLAEKIPLVQPEEQTDNWDDDFEEGISFTKIQG